MKKVLYLLLFSFTAQVMFAQGIDNARLERLIMNKVAEAENRRKKDQQKEENVQETHYKVATKTQNETAKIQQVANELHNNYRAENYISGLSQNPDYRAFTNQNDKKQQENRVAALEGRNTESAQKEKEELEKKRADDLKNAKLAPTEVTILNYESGNIEKVRPYLVEQMPHQRGWRIMTRNGKRVVYMNKGAYEDIKNGRQIADGASENNNNLNLKTSECEEDNQNSVKLSKSNDSQVNNTSQTKGKKTDNKPIRPKNIAKTKGGVKPITKNDDVQVDGNCNDQSCLDANVMRELQKQKQKKIKNKK